MTVRELREKYLRFFESKGHTVYPSGSLIPYDVTGRLDESLLFNGAGMIQFKPYFRGVAEPSNRRLTTAQKCVRTGDIESVGDLSHLTFFEMMGNFSFGDYFKEEAIDFSWEFLTSPEWLGLDARRLSFTVYHEDDVAYERWSHHLRGAGIDPAHRVFRLNEDTNYWPAGAFSAGPPGPCGPNSEMFYWVADSEPPAGPYTTEDWLKDDDAKNWLEIWNDVFIQYEWQGELKNPARPAEGYEKSGMPDLPFKSIDTGMGLERTAAVLGGKRSVYDTDAFTPILAVIDQLRGGDETSEEIDRARRVIADHIRTACFCIADGILPGNSGRGYVLRRLIRRAVLKGVRTLGFQEAFFHRVYEGVVAAMGDHYAELNERRDVIVETLKNEEALFRRTLAQGESLLNEQIALLKSSIDQKQRLASMMPVVSLSPRLELPGDIAFSLYDTFGFPLEVTIELCQEAGVTVDVAGFETAYLAAQERSRAGTDRESVYGGVEGSGFAGLAPTEFLGYHETEAVAKVVAVEVGGGKTRVALDRTPFYAESGGQVGDTGVLVCDGEAVTVSDVRKANGVFVHSVEGELELRAGTVLQAKVDGERRARIKRNHTATHLLHAALRQVLGSHVTQAGSYVGPDRLRFDFTHGKAMTDDQKRLVEAIVNRQALANTGVTTYADLPIAEAKAKGAMALFGEKYGDKVRMVEIGDFSRELCGGIHVGSTGEVGLFRIVSESSAASGVRRIEAVTGEGAYEAVLMQSSLLGELSDLLKSSPDNLLASVEKLVEQLREERKRREKAETAALRGESAGAPPVLQIGSVKLWMRNFGEVDPKLAAQELDNVVAQDPSLVAIAAVVSGGKVVFTAKAGAEAVKASSHVGNLVREVAKVAGGAGGGRPDFATAGGKDLTKIDKALAAAVEALRAQVKA